MDEQRLQGDKAEEHDLKRLVGKRSRILVVDDEDSILTLFKQLFEDEGVIVDTALEAQAALRQISEQRYDLLVIDKNLPGMNGLELLLQARKILPGVECIMITAYPSEDSKVLALLTHGAFDYLEKPFGSVVFLKQRLQQAIAKSQLANENTLLANTLKESQADMEQLRKQVSSSTTDLDRLTIYINEMVNRETMELQYDNQGMRSAFKNLHQRVLEMQAALEEVEAAAHPQGPAWERLRKLHGQVLYITSSKVSR